MATPLREKLQLCLFFDAFVWQINLSNYFTLERLRIKLQRSQAKGKYQSGRCTTLHERFDFHTLHNFNRRDSREAGKDQRLRPFLPLVVISVLWSKLSSNSNRQEWLLRLLLIMLNPPRVPPNRLRKSSELRKLDFTSCCWKRKSV